MPDTLTWDDLDEIAEALAAGYPGIDPLSVRFTQLHRMIVTLARFSDDPDAVTESRLEAIQMAWREMEG